MADIETKKIIEIEAKYDTLADLQGAVTSAKEAVAGLAKGTAAYEEGLADLKKAQKNYNDMQRLAVKENGAAKGSYNDLVNQLNRLKQAWNSTGDAMQRTALTKQINEVKEQIGDLDHSIGNWQRNVGNYAMAASSSLGTFKDALEKGAHAGENLKGSVENLGLGMKLLSTNPLMGVLVMLAPLINQIAAGLKENETALDGVRKITKLLEPAGKALTTIVDKLADIFGKVVDKVVEFAGENKALFGGIVTGAVGAGKALLESLLTPVRLLIDGWKGFGKVLEDIFTGNFKAVKDDARAAGESLGEDLRKGFSFRANFEEGKELGESLMEKIAGAKPRKAARDAGEKLGEEVADGIAGGLDLDKILAAVERRAEERRRYLADQLKAFEQDAGVEAGDIMTEAQSIIDETQAAIVAALRATTSESESAWSRMGKAVQTYGKAVTGILNDVSGAMQNNIKTEVENGRISEREGERRFRAVKGMQYAVTAINTFASVQSALSDPSAPSWIVKAANAAAALTSGIANMSKIANTTLGSTQKSSATGTGVQLATATAPIVQEVISTTRIVTDAQDTQSLVRGLGSIRAYVVTSELEGKLGSVASTREESSF